MGDRSMGAGWLTVEADAVPTDADLAGWLTLARENADARRRPPRRRPTPVRPRAGRAG